jgi:hypothetical protein
MALGTSPVTKAKELKRSALTIQFDAPNFIAILNVPKKKSYHEMHYSCLKIFSIKRCSKFAQRHA